MPEPTERLLQCRHIFTDGRRCGSPSLRNENFCYYHGKTRRPGPRQPQVKTLADRKNTTFDLPSPADLAERSGIQHAIGLILHKIAHNEIDPRRAGLLLYGLQIASLNLPSEKVKSKPAKPEELVEDVVHDADAGPLAPEADWEDNRPRSILERLVDEMERGDDLSRPADSSPINLNAVAAHPRIPCRSTRTGTRPSFHRRPGEFNLRTRSISPERTLLDRRL